MVLPVFKTIDPCSSEHSDVSVSNPLMNSYMEQYPNSDNIRYVIHLGKFYQYTPMDRHAWNEMVRHNNTPRTPGLGAMHARAHGDLSEEYWCGQYVHRRYHGDEPTLTSAKRYYSSTSPSPTKPTSPGAA